MLNDTNSDAPTHTNVRVGPCMRCKKFNTVENVSIAGLLKWRKGAFIQVALPELSAAEREMLLTGTCSECFDIMFPPDEDEDDE